MIHIKPTETRLASILNDHMNVQWRIQIPEVVACDQGYFLHWPDFKVDWKKRKTGAFTYEWETSFKYAQSQMEFGHRDNRGNPLTPTMLQGLRLRVGVRPDRDKVDLTIELQNTSDGVFRGVWAEGGCFQHQSQEFIDDRYERTCIKTEKGLVSLNKTDRSMEIRCAYVFYAEDYENPMVRRYEWFWGRSNVRPTSALIATQDISGKFAVGIGYEHAFLILQNSNSHHCMHSAPYFGTLNPKEKCLRRGVILFGEDAEELFKRFDELGFQQRCR